MGCMRGVWHICVMCVKLNVSGMSMVCGLCIRGVCGVCMDVYRCVHRYVYRCVYVGMCM